MIKIHLINKLKCKRCYQNHEFCEGLLLTAVTHQNVTAVRSLIEEDKLFTYAYLQATLPNGVNRTQTNLHDLTCSYVFVASYRTHELCSKATMYSVVYRN